MIKEIETGGPAFPCLTRDGRGDIGMTLRDYFAAKAMQGLCTIEMYPSMKSIAQDAYALADEMIEARGSK